MIGTVIGGISGYAFQILAAKMLSYELFSSFGAILSFYNIAMSLMLSINVIVVRNVSIIANNNLEKIELFNSLYFLYLLFFPFLLIFAFIFQDEVKNLLNIENNFLVYLIFILIWFSYVFGINTSFFNGLRKFTFLSIFNSLIFIFRLLFCGLGIYLGYMLEGIFISYIITFITLIVLSLFFLPKLSLLNFKFKKLNLKIFKFKYLAAPLVGNVSIILLMQADILVANKFFNSIESSNYIAAATLGKIVLYLPVSISTVLFPIVTNNTQKNISNKRVIVESLSFLLIIVFLITVFFFLSGNFIIHYLYNEKFLFSGEILKIYPLCMTPFVLIYYFEHIFLAKNKVYFSYLIFLSIPIFITYIFIFKPSIYEFLFINFILGFLILFFGYLFKFFDEIFR